MSLDHPQIAELKAHLRERFEALREAVRQELLQSDREQYVALAGEVADPGDASMADLLADLNLAVIDNHINEIRAVEQALMRMASGTYGLCADCEEPIDPARLQTQPAAKRCVHCQTRHEQETTPAARVSL